MTNNRTIRTFVINSTLTQSSSIYLDGKYVRIYKEPFKYEVNGNELSATSDKTYAKLFSKIISIDESKLCENLYKRITSDGKEIINNFNATFCKVTADYSEAIIGLWEGVEMTGDETYGDANHRIEFKSDGTYTYYVKDGTMTWSALREKEDKTRYTTTFTWKKIQ